MSAIDLGPPIEYRKPEYIGRWMTEEAAKALRAPFEASQIGKLPRKGTSGLDYVGHAAVTDRLLSVDPGWTWEPVAFDESGAPLIQRDDKEAKLWVRLTVCGVTRLGVGIASLTAFELEKQLISDALRNAAMRFGVALDLWSRQDLHDGVQLPPAVPVITRKQADEFNHRLDEAPATVVSEFKAWKSDQSFPWPWPVAAYEAMQDKLEELIAAEEPF